MKELLAGLVFILVIGLAAFSYRLFIEQPQKQVIQACTQEARVCPDGSSVGRTGPSCSFAPCAAPNLSIPEINATLLVPQGYSAVATHEGAVAIFATNTNDPTTRSISIRKYPIPAGKDATAVLLSETVFGASGENPKSLNEFKKVTIGGREYYYIVVERFEGVVSVSYYLVQDTAVLRFDSVEHDVADWTDPKLNIDNLPGHKALHSMLETIQL